MGEIIVIVLDLVAAVAVSAIAYILYRKFVVPAPKKDSIRDAAYEEGFSDAIKFFGLNKLYRDDPSLKHRMKDVFRDAGIEHRLARVIEGQSQPKSIESAAGKNAGG